MVHTSMKQRRLYAAHGFVRLPESHAADPADVGDRCAPSKSVDGEDQESTKLIRIDSLAWCIVEPPLFQLFTVRYLGTGKV